MSKPIITNIPKLIEEYQSGHSANSLAKQYNTSSGVITASLKRGGIFLRTLSEATHLKFKTFKHPSLGRKASEETKARLRAAHADVKGEKNPKFKGKGKMSEDGVWLNYDNHGYLRRTAKNHPLAHQSGTLGEHVYQACLKWGVEAVAGKEVHHKNGIKDDNRIENLLVLDKKSHRMIENNFIISNYAKEALTKKDFWQYYLVLDMFNDPKFKPNILNMLEEYQQLRRI
jgi:hypothetical protein